MLALLDFRPDDQRIVDNMLTIRSRDTGCATSIGDLVGQWHRFVGDLGRGRGGSRPVYEANLAVRGTLAEVEECLSVAGRQKLLASLLRADRQFLELTVARGSGLKDPWWRRMPRHRALTDRARRGPER